MGLNSIGSSPVFPNIFKSIVYVNNKILIGIQRKIFTSSLRFTKNNLRYVKFLTHLGVVNYYSLIRQKHYFYIKINLPLLNVFTNNLSLNFKIISKQSKKIFFSYNGLKLIKKRLGFATLVLSSSRQFQTLNAMFNFKHGGLALLLIY